MENGNSKKIVLSLFVIGCTLLVIGSAYAWFTLTLNGTKEQVITTGTLALILDDEASTGITLDKAIPTLEEVAMKKSGYTFTLENTGDIDSKYTIYLDDLPILDSATRLEDKYVRYNIQNDQGLNKTKLLSQLRTNPNRILDSGVIAPGKKYTYTLHVWVDYGADNNAMNKVFKGKIRVEAEQDTEYLPATLVNATYSTVDGVVTTRGYFWDDKENITKVIFHNEKMRPGGVVKEWDVSTTQDGTVVAYLTGEEVSGYTLYLQANGPIYANSDSSRLFFNFLRLEAIEGLENLDTSRVITMESMFQSCEKLEEIDLSHFDTSQVSTMEFMFNICLQLKQLDLSNFDTSKVTSFLFMFSNCRQLTKLDLSSFVTDQVTNMRSMFYYCNQLEELDISNFNTSKVTTVGEMFGFCEKLVKLDVSHFDTSKVVDFSSMFTYCRNLSILDVSHFNTMNAKYMNQMFYQCQNLKVIDVHNFDVSQVVDLSGMFGWCKAVEVLDVSHFNTENVVDMSQLFYNCNEVAVLDVSNFNTSQVTNMAAAFSGCKSLTVLNLANFVTTKVTRMEDLFFGCSQLDTLDLRQFDFSNVTSFEFIFGNIPIGIHIIVKDVTAQNWVIDKKSDFSTENVTIVSDL